MIINNTNFKFFNNKIKKLLFSIMSSYSMQTTSIASQNKSASAALPKFHFKTLH